MDRKQKLRGQGNTLQKYFVIEEVSKYRGGALCFLSRVSVHGLNPEHVRIWVFVLCLYFCVFILVNPGFCTFGKPSKPGATVSLSFSVQPAVGATTTIRATFLSLITSSNCGAGISTEKRGFEKLKEDDGRWSKLSIRKGQSFTLELTVKVIRPGVWHVSSSMGCEVPEDPEFIYNAAVRKVLVITDDTVQFYDETQETSKSAPWQEAYEKLPSAMVIVPPYGKGDAVYRQQPVEVWKNKEILKAVEKDEFYFQRSEKFTAYLPKETRLDFEPDYVFSLRYYNSNSHPEADPSWIKGPLTWNVQGNIGAITQDGIFTATKFGHGKICAKHGVLEDCLNVEVVPLLNMSPPDMIVKIVTVPYDAPQEKAWVKQMLSSIKGKKVRTVEEGKDFLFGKTLKRIQRYQYEKGHGYIEAFMDGVKSLTGTLPPKSAKTIKIENYIQKEIPVNTPAQFFSFGITASGGITTNGTQERGWFYQCCGNLHEKFTIGPCPRKVISSNGSESFKCYHNLGEGSFAFTEPGIYEMETIIYVVK